MSTGIHQRLENCIKSWEETDERIIVGEFNIFGRKLETVGVYAPNEDVDNLTKEIFYEKLTAVLTDINHRKEIFIFGDFNTRTGRDCNSLIVGWY